MEKGEKRVEKEETDRELGREIGKKRVRMEKDGRRQIDEDRRKQKGGGCFE